MHHFPSEWSGHFTMQADTHYVVVLWHCASIRRPITPNPVAVFPISQYGHVSIGGSGSGPCEIEKKKLN